MPSNLEELKKKYARDHEIAALKNLLPGERDHYAAGVARSHDKMLKANGHGTGRACDGRVWRPREDMSVFFSEGPLLWWL